MPLPRPDMQARYRMFDYFALSDQRKYYKSISAKHRLAASQVNRLRATLAFLTGFAAAAAALVVQSLFVSGAPCYQLSLSEAFLVEVQLDAENAEFAVTEEATAIAAARDDAATAAATPGATAEPEAFDPVITPQPTTVLQLTAVAAREEVAIVEEEVAAVSATTPVLGCGAWQQAVGVFTIAAIVLPAFGALFSTLADLYQWDRLITIYDAALENIEVADANSPEDIIEEDSTYRAALTAYTEGTLSVMSDETAQFGQAIRTPPQLEQFLEQSRKRAESTTKPSEPGNGTSSSEGGSEA